MTDQSPVEDQLKAAVIQGMQDAKTSLLYAQGLGQVHGPVGQLARAMIAEAEEAIHGVSFNTESSDDQTATLADVRAAVAVMALALSVGANEVVKRVVVRPIADVRGKHDAAKDIAEVADRVAEDGTTDNTLRIALEQLDVLYQQGEEGKVVVQEQYNLESATHIGATTLTMFNPGVINIKNPPVHGTYFRRHRMLAPHWTEWTEWVWSGGGELPIDRFNQPLRIAGTNELITLQGISAQG